MREVEKKMVAAARARENLCCGNTQVKNDGSIYLHGHHIATMLPTGQIVVNVRTLQKWPTDTTRSRLRALDVPVYRKDWNTYIGEKDIFTIKEDTITIDTETSHQ